ncbi:MAG: glycogen synthase [Myxococcales bacterium]|nr:glycogen synthase [Myxococcales bacterium]
MRILFVSSELSPLAKTGGLGDVSAALPRYLTRLGHDVRVFLPFYDSIDTRQLSLQRAHPDMEIRTGDHRYNVSTILCERPGEAPLYLIGCSALYHRGSLYTMDSDEHLRFLVLCRAAIESCQRQGFAPDVIHCNDWQTGLLPLTLKVRYGWDRLFASTRTLLTIHNLNYQGSFGGHILADTGLLDATHLFHQDQLHAGRVNFLLHGILYAGGVNTVSPTYAKEIQTEALGAGLDGLLRARSSTVVGILNGVDYDEWSPENDAFIPHRFDTHDLSGKAKNKQVLLSKMGLPAVAGVPLIGIVSRLAGQKGFAVLEEVMPSLLRRYGFQLVVLGSGEARFEHLFSRLARTFPKQVAFYQGFSNPLAHLIEAGADMFLMPSVYEPCGLNQMYSLRYGTVPIVHATGGLVDTVRPWIPQAGAARLGTGIVFEHLDAAGVRWGIESALLGYRDQQLWRRVMRAGMAEDFSWEKQAKIYEELYRRLCQDQGQG